VNAALRVTYQARASDSRLQFVARLREREREREGARASDARLQLVARLPIRPTHKYLIRLEYFG
jgi:hypothetical protein